MVERLQLRRRVDGLVYRFTKTTRADGRPGFLRGDGEYWLIWSDTLGWHAWDFETSTLTGRPWDALPATQNPDAPPEGEWVSKKADKTYVYDLVHTPDGG